MVVKVTRPLTMNEAVCGPAQDLEVDISISHDAWLKDLPDSAEVCREAAEAAFGAGAGGSLRAGVTENPVRLTRSVKDAITRVTCGGAPVYVWPGGGITFVVDVTAMPAASFGYVPTPALVAPIEFTMRADDHAAMTTRRPPRAGDHAPMTTRR